MRKSYWQMMAIVVVAAMLSIGITSAALRRSQIDTPAPAQGGAAPTDAKPAAGATPDAAADQKEAEEEDKSSPDPYEGIAPEELPPDLQYNADDSVSFPVNI